MIYTNLYIYIVFIIIESEIDAHLSPRQIHNEQKPSNNHITEHSSNDNRSHPVNDMLHSNPVIVTSVGRQSANGNQSVGVNMIKTQMLQVANERVSVV